MTGPLAGVRIVEMDAIGPVPLACMILSGLGADVVRVARAGGGAWGNLCGMVLNRGRTTVTLDLKVAEDRNALLDLLAESHAVVEGFRPGVMERLGLGPDVCLGRNPALVYARVTGWGQTGPLAQRAGHDLTYLAVTGALHAIGPADGPPTVPLNLIGDYGGGTMFAALGIVSALLSAHHTGKGQVVDVAMVDGVANLLSLFHEMLAGGQWKDRRESNLLDGGTPYYRCYTCADGGHVAVGALEPQFFARLIDGLGIPKDRFVQHDRAAWPAMTAEFTRIFASRTRDDWAAHFIETDACVAPVLSLAEAPAYPANHEREVFVSRQEVVQAAPAPRFSATPGSIRPGSEASIDAAIRAWRDG